MMLDIAAETMPTPAKRVCRETNAETEIASSIDMTAENGTLSHNNNNDDKTRKTSKNSMKSGKTNYLFSKSIFIYLGFFSAL